MKFRAKFETNEYNNSFTTIQVKKFLFWKTLYYKLSTFDGLDFWPVMFSCTEPYNPDATDLINKLNFDKEIRKNYYVKTIFGYRRVV